MIPIILIFNLILLIFDVPLFIFTLMLHICIASRLVWKNNDTSFYFFFQFLLNGILELGFIALEYFLVRIPLYGIFNKQYVEFGQMPGLIYGLSVYLPVTINIGQFLVALTRFCIIKFPFSFQKFVNKRVMIGTQLMQFACPLILLIWSFKQNIQAVFMYDNSTIKIESSDQDYTMNSILICIIMCVFWSAVNVILSVLSIYYLTTVTKKMSDKSKEKPLLIHSCIQITAQTFLAIVATLQYISFVNDDKILGMVSMYLYSLAEDMVSLSPAAVLFFISKQVRDQFIDFYRLQWVWDRRKAVVERNQHQLMVKAGPISYELQDNQEQRTPI
uniref:Serpentine receptor class gamma n=1 Tax=Rhabditophanes sp. KR3021 TaxID=114890 RepID=A0AC35UGP6_9BILA